MDRERHDVFFSYAWENKALADQLVGALTARGLDVFQDEPGMEHFADISVEIELALRRSRTLLAFYTPDFLRSPYCHWELYNALTGAYRLDGDVRRILTVVRDISFERVRPGRLTDLRLPDGAVASADEIADAVTAKLASIDDRCFGDVPTPAPPQWNTEPLMPMQDFCGREAELWEIHDALSAPGGSGRGSVAVARITGLGGQGKTTLAEQYARTFAQDYPAGILELRGFGSHSEKRSLPQGVRAQLVKEVARLARWLGLTVNNLDAEAIQAALRAELNRRTGRYLWIIDDIPADLDHDTFAALLAPSGHGRSLITTRSEGNDYGYPWGTEIRLDGLYPRAAVKLLTSKRRIEKTQRAELKAADELASLLGYHPLGLALAAGLAALPGNGYQELHRAVESPDADALELGARLWRRLPTGHQASIAATMLASIDRLDGAARDLLRIASLLSPAPIPADLFAKVLADRSRPQRSFEQAAQVSTDGLNAAAGLGLAAVADPGPAARWTVHTLVSRTVRFADVDRAGRRELRDACLVVLTTELERCRDGSVDRELADYLPHVSEVAGAFTGLDEWHALNEAARIYVELGDTETSLDLFERLYESCRTALGDQDLTTLRALAGLGVAYGLKGDHAVARAHKQRAYDGLREVLGQDDPDTLTALGNLAVTCADEGDHETAREIYAKVYRARRRSPNSSMADLLTALSNYAISVGKGGNHRLAYRLKQIIYERNQALHGAEHPYTLDALNNLACSANALGDNSTASQLFDQVRQVCERVLGPRHPQALNARENFTITSALDDKAASFRAIYEARLEARDPGHPNCLSTLRHLLIASRTAGLDTPVQPMELIGAEELSPDIELGEVRLDDLAMDDKVEILQLALESHEQQVAELGPDAPASLRFLCYVAHALAAVNQMDRQVQDSLELIEDAAAGLDEQLGVPPEDRRTAQRLLDWIRSLAADN